MVLYESTSTRIFVDTNMYVQLFPRPCRDDMDQEKMKTLSMFVGLMKFPSFDVKFQVMKFLVEHLGENIQIFNQHFYSYLPILIC